MTVELTADYLRELLNFDPETGQFRRKVSSSGRNGSAGCRAGSLNDQGYRLLMINRKRYAEHRLAWLYFYGSWPAQFIDHINGNRSDNRISNLRDVPLVVNNQNQREPRGNNTNGFLGVRVRNERIYAEIAVNGKSIKLGNFPSKEAAHEAYVQAKRKLHPGCTL